jgi:hypothetical protein
MMERPTQNYPSDSGIKQSTATAATTDFLKFKKVSITSKKQSFV